MKAHIDVMQEFLKTVYEIIGLPLAQLNRMFIRYCNQRNEMEAICWWCLPGYRRLRQYLESLGYLIGMKNHQSIILARDTDRESLILDPTEKGTAIIRTRPPLTKQQAAQLWQA